MGAYSCLFGLKTAVFNVRWKSSAISFEVFAFFERRFAKRFDCKTASSTCVCVGGVIVYKSTHPTESRCLKCVCLHFETISQTSLPRNCRHLTAGLSRKLFNFFHFYSLSLRNESVFKPCEPVFGHIFFCVCECVLMLSKLWPNMIFSSSHSSPHPLPIKKKETALTLSEQRQSNPEKRCQTGTSFWIQKKDKSEW